MDKSLTKDEVVSMINAILQPKLDDLKKEMKDFRRFNPLDSVTDLYSPITGASQQIGFFGTSKISKPTVTGSKGANAALTSLCTALANLGLITNSTS